MFIFLQERGSWRSKGINGIGGGEETLKQSITRGGGGGGGDTAWFKPCREELDRTVSGRLFHRQGIKEMIISHRFVKIHINGTDSDQ